MFENPRVLERIIEYTYLAMTWIAAFTCLVRTDYNFAFGLFGYYYWVSRINSAQVTRTLIVTNAALIVFDIIWLLTAASHWGEEMDNAPIWNSTSGIRSFAVFFSSINILVKFIGVGALYLLTRNLQRHPDHDNVALNSADYLGGGDPYGQKQSMNPYGGNPSYNPNQGGGYPSYSPNQSYNPG
mmetsp:Transcript_14656/g.12477  ORF Transcript_14656/g.12477 Transcript_14656/m.12477 type:complete len:184 (+) Transcript_14656:32-583(+)